MTLLDTIRRERRLQGHSRAGLAREAGLNVNSLRYIDREDWNPTWRTITSVIAVLKPNAETELEA